MNCLFLQLLVDFFLKKSKFMKYIRQSVFIFIFYAKCLVLFRKFCHAFSWAGAGSGICDSLLSVEVVTAQAELRQERHREWC